MFLQYSLYVHNKNKMVLTFDYVWDRIFVDIPVDLSMHYDYYREMCENISTARNVDSISVNQVSNLIRGIRRDIGNGDSSWRILLFPDNFGDFLERVKSYQTIRGKFPSLDKEPVDPMCLPYSNEILFGKGLNSHVRDTYFENE